LEDAPEKGDGKTVMEEAKPEYNVKLLFLSYQCMFRLKKRGSQRKRQTRSSEVIILTTLSGCTRRPSVYVLLRRPKIYQFSITTGACASLKS